MALQEDVTEDIRMKSARILRQEKPPKGNISTKEMRAIRIDLNKNETILMLPVKKGNSTFTMNTNDYEDNIRDLLDPIPEIKTTQRTTY